ncbi:MAG: trans-sulfuration enzyme family protein [Flavobacteriaceae bacterium]
MGKKQFETQCVHEGQLKDTLYKGAISPLYMATAYSYEETDRYPRYFNTPNQVGLAKKIAALEGAEAGLIFGSGMAAISTALLAFLKKGDHVVLQNDLYGGTTNLVVEHFENYGIEYAFAQGLAAEDFEAKIQENTKVVYVETPSNPLMKLVDLTAIARLAKKHDLVSMIDNTFASPVNQNPIAFGIDVVLHSATKHLGGHSDILAGAAACSAAHMEKIFAVAKSLGGNLSELSIWLLERSIKTLSIRVKQQNENALALAHYLESHPAIEKVHYPGLPSHPDHALAKKQMRAYTGMMSFELKANVHRTTFEKALALIQPVVSLAGVESTITIPAITSHKLLSPAAREEQGITDQLVRFSVGIEHLDDLKNDLNQALTQATHEG